jgi:manganese/zinc/iron transport system permease protein
MFDYNTRLVLICAALLGTISGMVGVYLILRKRSLIGDAVCHAASPGLGIAFLVQVLLGGDGKNLGWLLLGAAVSGAAGALSILAIRRWTNLKEDAAMAIVLSVFFGLGMVFLSIVQDFPNGNAAGLENFILGKSATMVANDAVILIVAASIVVGSLVLFRKELQLMCFDSGLATAQGWPILALDLLLLSSVLIVVIVGANIVGVILVVALLVIPPAAARFWTHSLPHTIVISGSIGAASGILGALSSLLFDRVPSGASIVLAASLLFVISLLFGNERGLVWRLLRIGVQRSKVDQEHVLRSIYEVLEARGIAPQELAQVRSDSVNLLDIERMRDWPSSRLSRVVRRIVADGFATQTIDGKMVLTASGIKQSMRAVRKHRLLELYFSRWADLSPDAIDRGADYTEHALDDDLLAQLEKDAMVMGDAIETPKSLHPIPMK